MTHHVSHFHIHPPIGEHGFKYGLSTFLECASMPHLSFLAHKALCMSEPLPQAFTKLLDFPLTLTSIDRIAIDSIVKLPNNIFVTRM